MRRVIRSSRYERAAAKLLRPSVQQGLEEAIAAAPEHHPVVPGTGGFRKARWRRDGGGKSGGVRVIYYFMVRPDVVFLADLYAKNEKENLTHAERNQLQKIASEIQQEFGG
ncbi:MAG: type II toxin-antitoxin system RelE/ParE family toxin [Acidobacteriales bacterium]|nr:type II toxin-antitoxin system RelE/ParE family toxin [Terriglobales bacterium]